MIRHISVKPAKLWIALPAKRHCAIQFFAIVAALATTACGGGGGGGYGGGAPVTTVVSPGATGSTPPTSSTNSPVSPQFATVGGPTFDGPIYPPSNVGFPALSRTLEAGSSVSSIQDTTVTVIDTSGHSSTVRVVVPSAGIDKTVTMNTNLLGFQGDTQVWGLSYVALGEWADWTSGRTNAFTETVFGYETPVSAIPTSGTAQFSGWASAVVFKSGSYSAYVYGSSAFSVDFASGRVTGAFTNMQQAGSPWNDVSVSGSIAAGTNRFGGTTAVTSTPNTPNSFTGLATGLIDGGFYGPSAQNLGAVWSLSEGTSSALGGVVARR